MKRLALALLAAVAIAAVVYAVFPRPNPLLARVALPIAADRYTTLAVDAPAGRAFIADDGVMRVLDLRTGAPLRTLYIGALPFGRVAPAALTMAVDERDSLLFLANPLANALSTFDMRGDLLHSTVLGDAPAAVAVDGSTGRAVVASAEAVSLVDVPTGAVVGTLRLPLDGGDLLGHLAVDARTGRGFAAAPPFMAVFDVRTGMSLGTIAIPGGIGDMVDDAPAACILVANPGNGTVTVLDARTGTVLRTIAVGSTPDAIVVDEQTGRAFVASSSAGTGAAGTGAAGTGAAGTVSMLDVRSGRLLRAVRVAAPLAMAIDGPRGRVLVAGAAGLTVLDARDGTALCTFPLAGLTGAMAIDEPPGRVLAVSAGSVTTHPDPWSWVPSPVRRLLPFLPPPGPRTIALPPGLSVLDEAGLCG